MEKVDKFVWGHRNIIAGLPLLIMLISTRWEYENEAVIWTIAITLCVFGIALRSWANCHCWYAEHRQTVVTKSGPYAYVRNPMYIGNLLILMGSAEASELIWMIPIAFIWAFLVYIRVVQYEEKTLITSYGEDFVTYMEQVPRWIPKKNGVPSGSAEKYFLKVTMIQALNLLILVPFLIKELDPWGLW